VAAGEAAGVFVLSGPEPPAWAGDRRSADILAVATGYGPGGGTGAERALTACVQRARQRAGVRPTAISTVLTGEAEEADDREYGPVVHALGHRPRRILSKRLLGECDAAAGAVALALLLAAGPAGGPGLSLLTARGPDGAVGAAIVRRCADAGGDRG